MLIRKLLGLLAVGGLLVVAAPTPQAQAASPLTPGVTTAIQQGSAGTITQVQHRHRRHYHPRRHYHHRHHYVPRVYVPRVYHRHHHRHHHRRW
ncbi:hypothetical protein ACWX0K_02325 [Nitrobacteraceae bacterium UC4446_H13]|jgi:hypothetical protein